MVLAVITVVGFGANALAGWGKGYGHHGPGWDRGFGYGPGRSYMIDNLSEEDFKKIDAERRAFFDETADLRRDRYAKRLELKSELVKENPDPEKASRLQKELSDIKAKFDQKRLEHILKMKKINPKFGGGFEGRGKRYRGYGGRGFRGHDGEGPRGYGRGGYCWR
jgi:hypothetical protein